MITIRRVLIYTVSDCVGVMARSKDAKTTCGLRDVASRPGQEMVEALAWAGFNGIYIDRFGYMDNGVKIEKRTVERVVSLADCQPKRAPDLLRFDRVSTEIERKVPARAVGDEA